MTCVVGLQVGGEIYMGADSLGSSETTTSVRADPKLFYNRPLLAGYSGSYRMGQILQHYKAPPLDGRQRPDDYVFALVEHMREEFKKHGLATTRGEMEDGNNLLLGLMGDNWTSLYLIDCDFQYGKSAEGYFAIGSGGDFAMGSLHTSARYDIEPEERLLLALRAAQAHAIGVRAPFLLASSERVRRLGKRGIRRARK